MTEDRRKVEAKLQELLKELTLAQRVSLSELNHYGFNLSFVRKTPEGKLFIVEVNENILIIDEQGQIDNHSVVKIRS